MNNHYTRLRHDVSPKETTTSGSRGPSVSPGDGHIAEMICETEPDAQPDSLSSVTTQRRKITTISVPAGYATGGGELDLDSLFKWMKKHPSGMPVAVQKEVGYLTGDISSAVRLVINDHLFWLFLSCYEPHWLVRICLIEKNTFVLFKGRGRSEDEPSLSIGDVNWEGRQIRSMVNIGSVPLEYGQPFYSIFWNWWLKK